MRERFRLPWDRARIPSPVAETRFANPKLQEEATWRGEGALVSRSKRRGIWFGPEVWRKDYKRANEAEMRLEFMSVGQPMVDGGDRGDDWYWYFLMQHYGCPTRLLDWSTNPLVALYFAVRYPKKRDAAVWVLDPWRWNRAHVKDLFGPAIPGWKEAKPYLLELEEAFDTETNENQTRKKWPMTIEPPHIDRRIAAQGSKFVLFGKSKDMLDSPAINRKRNDKGTHAIVDRIIIPCEYSETILAELNSLGVNQRSLFPDLEGLGGHIAWEWGFPSGTEAIRLSASPRRRLPQEKPTAREKVARKAVSKSAPSKSLYGQLKPKASSGNS